MAISPPTDIVLDVARAVDPTEVAAARAQLMRRAGGSAEPFSVSEATAISRTTMDTDAQNANPADKFKRFEAMVLQTFIQNMLPKDTEGVYGKGLAGDMWKSQLAQRIADVMADRGGIGIANSLLADHYMDGKRIMPLGPVSTGLQGADIDDKTRLSTSMVQEFQMKMTRSLGENGLTDETSTEA